MKLGTVKIIALGLRSLHRIAQELKRANHNYELLHEHELAAARQRQEVVDSSKTKVYYQSDQKLYESELKEKVERAVRAGELL